MGKKSTDVKPNVVQIRFNKQKIKGACIITAMRQWGKEFSYYPNPQSPKPSKDYQGFQISVMPDVGTANAIRNDILNLLGLPT